MIMTKERATRPCLICRGRGTVVVLASYANAVPRGTHPCNACEGKGYKSVSTVSIPETP